MLAGVRSFFPSSFPSSILVVLLSLAVSLPLQSQVNGVPASVTSLGFGGHMNPTPGVRASVTSLGPNGYGNSWPVFGGCCANFFLAQGAPPRISGARHRRHHHDQDYFPIGISEPVYVPVPYAAAADDDSDDEDYEPAATQRTPRARDRRAIDREPYSRIEEAVKPGPAQTEGPVVAQLSTVLVFKDGHKSDVLNYAIVGDTLFDFGAGRTTKILLADLDLPATRRINDDRGVDFQVPVNSKKQ